MYLACTVQRLPEKSVHLTNTTKYTQALPSNGEHNIVVPTGMMDPIGDKMNESTAPQLPEDLIQLLNSAATLKDLHTVLQVGLFPGGYCQTVQNLMKYAEAVHKQTIELIQEHPDYSLIGMEETVEIKPGKNADGSE